MVRNIRHMLMACCFAMLGIVVSTAVQTGTADPVAFVIAGGCGLVLSKLWGAPDD